MRSTADRLFGRENYQFSVLGAGRHQMSLVTMASIMGGNVRVGLEDSIYVSRGVKAQTNAEQVRKIRRILEELSFEIATPAGTRSAAAGGSRYSLKVLVADDNAANGKVLKNLLEAAGHAVELVTDGEAALATLERSPVDLALLDINMPEVNGYEVAKLFRMGHVGEARLPIIAISGGTTNSRLYLDIAGKIGARRILPKPFTPRELIRLIEQVLAEEAQQPVQA